jgi:hypothetical protein
MSIVILTNKYNEKMKKKEFWYFLLKGEMDAKTGVIGNFYAYGDHLGDALANTIMAPFDFNFRNQDLIEALLLENFDLIGRKNELFEIADGVYMQPTLITFALKNPGNQFVPPVGIVKNVYGSEFKYDLMKESFVASGANEDGIFEFEMVLEKKNLIDTFIKTISFLPTIDGCWIYLKNNWESESNEIWVAKHFTDKQKVIDFLQKEKKNTLENGYLDIILHSLTGETNLTLDDHKKIQLHTKDNDVFNAFVDNITGLGYKQTKQLFNMEVGYEHFHYRPGKSLTRTEFRQMLKKYNFEQAEKFTQAYLA